MKLDNHHALGAVLIDYAVIAGAIALHFASPWLLPVSVLIIGSRQRALATILHESSHRVFARWRWWNHVCGTFLSGYLIFQTLHRYRRTHVREHHGNLGDPLRDPDTRGYVEQGLFDVTLTREQFVVHLLKACFLLKLVPYLRSLLRDRLLPGRWNALGREEKREYFVFLAYWAFLLSVSWWVGILKYVLLLWILPYLTSFQVFGWLIEIAEHYPLAAYSERDIDVTRNRHDSGWLEWFLTGAHAEQYHLTHHLRPSIPFWNMAKAHLIMMDDSEYREVTRFSGGIFSSRRPQIPTILEEIWNSLPSRKYSRWQREVRS